MLSAKPWEVVVVVVVVLLINGAYSGNNVSIVDGSCGIWEIVRQTSSSWINFNCLMC